MTGILLIQLGTPDAPTPAALRPTSASSSATRASSRCRRWKWWLILNLFILPPPAGAVGRQVPPHLGPGHRLAAAALHPPAGRAAAAGAARTCRSRFGMQVGNPPLGAVVREMIAQGVDRLIVLPMYPQYSATTTASATDALFQRC